ncbi:MAG: 2-C-methyl-D-erythritol 2,4-cyclodiphosphate synthase [Clostridiales bacterium]|nr:2-C-methyl-D-erythritol 2,4-cyclodiphosphate synthase [Clostridiales bacterium]
MRIGQGFDAHRLAPGRALVLGGVTIDHPLGLLGHSDADVLCHAIADALLGAAALGDLGRHFPDSDPTYKDVSSLLLLQKTAALLSEKGLQIVNIDATVTAQTPRLALYIALMRENIAAALGICTEQVSVKATTTEGLGFTGRGEGIAVFACALAEESRGLGANK